MRGARGFTMVELLVVLVIIGSLVSLTVLSTGIAGPSRELHNEAERLAGLIGVLADEAVLDNREYGLRLERDSYRVMRYDEQKAVWTALGKEPHRLPSWARLEIELEGAALQLATQKTPAESSDETDEASEPPQPQLLLLSSGELSPFRLALSDTQKNGQRLQMSSDGFRLPRVEVVAQ